MRGYGAKGSRRMPVHLNSLLKCEAGKLLVVFVLEHKSTKKVVILWSHLIFKEACLLLVTHILTPRAAYMIMAEIGEKRVHDLNM